MTVPSGGAADSAAAEPLDAATAALASSIADSAMTFPRLRLRSDANPLLDLPWALPLEAWNDNTLGFREIPIGPSRHLVRFLVREDKTYALKELPLDLARREYDVLRHLEIDGLPAVSAVGLAESVERRTAILVTEYLRHSLQYRRLMMRLPAGAYRDRLLDGMAWLLVDLHRSGVFWGDCSLANTLFRRDGDRMQAYLVDAETSEVHERLSDGQRAYDLEVLVENVAFGLADLALMQNRPDDLDDAIQSAEAVRRQYDILWRELTDEPLLRPDDRFAVRARIRRLNELGFAVDEIELVPGEHGRVRLKVAVTTRLFHVRELERLTGIRALEGQAQLLLNDLREYRAWLEWFEKRPIPETEAAQRWLVNVFEPTVAKLRRAIAPERDIVQAYCDILEHKWLLSEAAGRDVGLEAAIESYLKIGAPAPEAGAATALDLELLATHQDRGPIPD
jgi:tRNA A-37 threonylcarbamoyl transferase component Bud32